MKRIVIACSVLGAFGSGIASATPPGPTGIHKLKVCHATASATNPYNIIDVDLASWSATPGIDSNGRPLNQSNHWGHQAEFGGKGDFWLEDTTMTCKEFAQWLDDSKTPASYVDQGRDIWVACNSREANDGSRIPDITRFVDATDGHIIEIPCPDWHGALLAPSDTMLLSKNTVWYWVTNAAGKFPVDFGFHTKFNPTPGATSTITLDPSGGNFALLCPVSASIDVQTTEFDWESWEGGFITRITEMPCTAGQPVVRNELFGYGSDFAPIAQCPDEGKFRACYTGNSGMSGIPSGLTAAHACFEDYACIPGEAVDFTRLVVTNAGFFEFFVAYLP